MQNLFTVGDYRNILLEIVSYLNVKNIGRLSLVSKALYIFLSSPIFWSNIAKRNFECHRSKLCQLLTFDYKEKSSWTRQTLLHSIDMNDQFLCISEKGMDLRIYGRAPAKTISANNFVFLKQLSVVQLNLLMGKLNGEIVYYDKVYRTCFSLGKSKIAIATNIFGIYKLDFLKHQNASNYF